MMAWITVKVVSSEWISIELNRKISGRVLLKMHSLILVPNVDIFLVAGVFLNHPGDFFVQCRLPI